MGLEVEIYDIFNKFDKDLVKDSQAVYISVNTYQNSFIFALGVGIYIMTPDPSALGPRCGWR